MLDFLFAKEFAINAHANVNQLYDGQPYAVHLCKVVSVAEKFIHLVPIDWRDCVLAACWLHDTIEDARLTYNDIKKQFGVRIADMVYALSNEKGKTRAERANDKYYKGIRDTPDATFVKLCDRIANFEYSKQTKSRMEDCYREENEHFISQLYDPTYNEMIDYIKSL